MSLQVISQSLRPIGALPMGAVAEAWGAPIVVGSGGVVVAIFIVVMNFVHRKIRSL